MKVHQIMRTSVITVTPKTPFKELWEAIFKKRLHSLPVVDAQNTLLGIIAEEDLVRRLYPDFSEIIDDFKTASDFEEMESNVGKLTELKAGDVMHTRVIFTRADTPIMRALSRMLVRNVRQLPVVSGEGVVIGVISKRDIVDALMKRRPGKSATKSGHGAGKASKK